MLFGDVLGLFLGPGAHPRHEVVTSQPQGVHSHQNREQDPPNKKGILNLVTTLCRVIREQMSRKSYRSTIKKPSRRACQKTRSMPRPAEKATRATNSQKRGPGAWSRIS